MSNRALGRNVQIIAVFGTSIALIASAAMYSASASGGQPWSPKQSASTAPEAASYQEHPSGKASAPAVRTARPSMLEILQSAQALADAGVLPDQQVQAAPPEAPVETPPPVVVPQPAPDPVAPTTSGWYDDAYVARVLNLVNARRAGAGLPPVAAEPHLVGSATNYAKVLSDNNWFSHTGPDGRTFIQRVEAAGLPFTVPLGEILAWGTQSWSSESLVQAWMNSPPHRSEILSPLYTHAGASCYFTPTDGITVYCVVDFAG
jgi:uncharacterized protein YkwD